MLSTPWRLALVFLVAGVASYHLITRFGPGGYAMDRLRRLLPVIIFGMLVVNAPQTWIVALANGLTHVSFWQFWPAYLHNDQSVFPGHGMVMPRWDHIWFLLYLLPYGLLFALAWKLRLRLPAPKLWVLLLFPAVWLVLTNILVDRVWPVTDSVFNDWGAHLRWLGMFVAGVKLAPREDAWRWMERHRARLAGIAALLAAALIIDHALWLRHMLAPPFDGTSYDAISGVFGWSVILSACGFARHYLNRSSLALSYLNTAILPVYVLHQPLLFAACTLLFPLRLPLLPEALILTLTTFGLCFAIYHVVIRPFALTQFFFGLKITPRTKTAQISAA
jgi:hypothetical protein